ncbi:MAG TPA: glycosyltransferase family 4 protein [Leucothrix sp.]|nr:glycosyltransferase family 4 protein [Leucothrix sp.]
MMRKIAIFVPDLELGGGQRVAVNMAEMFAKAGDNVQIVMMSDDASHFDTNVPIVSLNCQKKGSFIGKLLTIAQRVKAFKKLIKQEKYDVIISFLESANLCAFLSAPKKSILTIHGNPIIFTGFDRLMLTRVLRYSKNLVTVSDGLKVILEDQYGLKNVGVIKNATDPLEIQEKAIKDTFTHPRKFMVAAGRIADVKQFDVMMDAFYQSKASQDDNNAYDLIIIGDGEDREALEMKISLQTKKTNSQGTVHLVGQKSNPFPIFNAAKFYLMSSKTEAFPMVLLEALSLGKPLVAYDCPTGVKEILVEGENGLLVENQNQDALADAIDKMVYEKGLQEQLASNAVKSVENFTPENINKQWQSTFDQLEVKHKK